MKTVRVIASGSVQGVGFRFFIQENARTLRVNGSIKNLSNGSVEAIFQGDRENVDKLISLCKKGPEASSVTDVQIEPFETSEIYRDFFVQ